MSERKISEFPKFEGQKLLLAAQQRGHIITRGNLKNDAAAAMVIGLVNMMYEMWPGLTKALDEAAERELNEDKSS